MKTKAFLFTLLIAACLTSCKKDKLDSPGNISGMGSSQGDFEIKEPFKLPDGINIVGQSKELFDPFSSSFGSGYGLRVALTLSNSTDVGQTVFFPKGLIWKCSSSENHNGILLQTTWVNLQPHSERVINILLNCINWTKPSTTATQDISFDPIGVSSSHTISTLLKLIGWRRINYEMIYGTINGVTTDPNSGPTYNEIIDSLQNILTGMIESGNDISDEDRSFIESIPVLSTAEIPSSIDNGYQFPEFTVPVK